MKVELIEIGPSDEKRAWEMLPRHVIQSTLHNELVRKIHDLRNAIETASAQDVPALQAEIKAYRYFLGLLHRNDNLPTR